MILDRFRIDGQVAVVTGAGRGLGKAIAVAFAEAGADVLIAARTESELADVAELISATGRQAHTVVADLGHPAAAAELAPQAIERFGRLDTVVNNVGGAMPSPLLDTTPEALAEAFTFNVTNAHELVRTAVPRILDTAGGGSILNITSTMGRLPGRAFAAYGTAKAALAHYTRLAALDLNPRIRVNAIAPGSIRTSALGVVAANDAMRTELESKTPLGTLGEPEDIAAAALYLVSPAGKYLTGKVIEPDGGLITPNLDLPIPDL